MEEQEQKELEELQNDELSGSDELYEFYRYVADPKQSMIRIDKFLTDRLERTSRNRIQNAIRAGSVKVNDEEIKPNYKIRPYDVVTIVLPNAPGDDSIHPDNIPLDIVYEDDDVLIINKQPNMVVHPGLGNHRGTLVNALAYYFQGKEMPIMVGNLPDRPGLVHRIDKDTSGLMVIAKTEFAMTHLAKQFYDHTIHRRYQALVWGEPEELEGTVDANIGRDPNNRMQFTVFPDGSDGKWAVTHYKVIEGLYYVSLVECALETGRTHQIRVHMKSLGHPLFNDERYGGNYIRKGTVFTKYKEFVNNAFALMPRQALHAKELGFIHPRTGEEVFFSSELPDDFTKVLEKWRNYVKSRKDIIEQEKTNIEISEQEKKNKLELGK